MPTPLLLPIRSPRCSSGNLLWLTGQPLALVSLWWAAFLVPAIAGEHLEWGRRQLPPRRLSAFTAAVATLLVVLGLSVAALGLDELRRWGGLLNGVTVGLFVAFTLAVVRRARSAQPPVPAVSPGRPAPTNADTIAAENIRVLGRAAVMQPHVSETATVAVAPGTSRRL